MGPTARVDCWRDLSVLLEGACVATLEAVFRSDLSFASGEAAAAQPLAPPAPAGGVPVRVVPSGPDELGDAIS